MPDERAATLAAADVVRPGTPLSFLSMLRLDDPNGGVMHVIMLDGAAEPAALRAAAGGLVGVRFVDPAGDFSVLLGQYRGRAMALLVLSALIMAPLLMWRYGVGQGLWIMAPPSLAVFLAGSLRTFFGGTFTFFDAMALVLVLSIGVDYAVFCAETSGDRKPVTVLAVALAAGTALMSFGLLALSDVAAVHNFGATMLIGIFFAFLLAPMVRMPHSPRLLRGVAGLLLLILCGCGTKESETGNASALVHLSPDLILTLPRPGDIGRAVEATQLVTARFGPQSIVFEGRISATKDRFLFTALDMIGRKAVSINWTADSIAYESAPWVPTELQPQNILADMVILYWPEYVVRQALRGSAGTLLATRMSRTVRAGDHEILRATYKMSHGDDVWSGQIDYRNLAWNYELSIQSTEASP